MKEKLKDIIQLALKEMGIEEDKITLEIPKEKTHGDFSSNIAMQICKKLSKSPREVAEDLIEKIKDENIKNIKIAGPGFINFYLKPDYLKSEIFEVLSEKENYGKLNIGNNKKVNIEYVSANPTGILHLGTARGASYGDNIANILKFTGYNVTREYYVNDAGNQIKNLGQSLKVRYQELLGMTPEFPKDGYHGSEIKTLAKKIQDEYNEKALNEPDNFFEEKAVAELLNTIKKDLKDFRVEFDVWTSEKSIYQKGKVEESLQKLKDLGETYEEDGALWLKTTKYGDEKDRVIVRSDGTYTYVTPDIAYHLDKLDRGFDKLIDVFGADHHGYISRIKAGVNALGYDDSKLEIKILQMVKLLRNKEVVKMSKRSGETVTISELIKEVGVDAARYFFAMRSLDTQMDFDIELATKKTNENPVYYINYAYARISSILEDAKDMAIPKTIERINVENAYDILKKISEFKDVISSASNKREPHLIANYVYELASAFHSYYGIEHILTNDKEETAEKIALITAVKIIIENSLKLIGVKTHKKM